MIHAASFKLFSLFYQQWTSTQLHLACIARVAIGLEGGYNQNGQQSISTKILHGRDSMPLLLQSIHRATSESARKCFFIVITK